MLIWETKKWSSGYGRRLPFKGLRVLIQAADTMDNFPHLFAVKLFEKTEKEAAGGPFFLSIFCSYMLYLQKGIIAFVSTT